MASILVRYILVKRSFVKIILVGAGNIINALLGFLFISSVAKILDTGSFGKYALLSTLLVAVSKLTDFGTNSVYVADSIATEDKKLTNIFYTLKIILLLFSITVSIVVLKILNLGSLTLSLYFVLGLIAYCINYTLNAFFQKKEKFFHLVSLNTLPAIIKGVSAILILTGKMEINLDVSFGIFSLSIFSSSLLSISLLDEIKKFKLDFSKTKEYLTKSSPAGISQLIHEGWPSLSNSIAKITGSFSNVGIYSLAEKISNILYLASVSIFTVLLPKNAYAKKRNEKYNFKEVFIISLLVILMAFFGTFASKFFVSEFFGDKFSESLPLLSFLVFASAFTSIQMFMENYFFIENKTNYIMYINVGRLILFLALSWLFIPNLSLKGLSLSNLLSSIFSLVLSVLLIRKVQKSKSI